MRISPIRAGMALATLLFCGVAQAHPGHGASLMAGLLHPLTGLDHLLAMLLVGVWAAQRGGQARWQAPASFVAVMTLSAGFGMLHGGLPIGDGGVAATVLAIGVLIACSVKVRPLAGAAIVGLFALCHGYLHGVEMPQGAAYWQYGAGFVAATLMLHGLGLLAGAQLRRVRWALPAAGVAASMCGGWLLAGALS